MYSVHYIILDMNHEKLSVHAWGDSWGERFVVYNMEKLSQICEIHFAWSCWM